MNVLKRIVAGDNLRHTRFHDEQGRLCNVNELPGALYSAVTRVWGLFSDKRLFLPWWVWGAISHLEATLRKDDSVVEIGSGFSTLWLCERVAQVVSVESSLEWMDRITSLASTSGVRNLQMMLSGSFEGYERALMQGYKPNVVILDSEQRITIFRHAVSYVKPPRVVVFDDTDREDYRAYRSILADCESEVRTFRGFKPYCLHVCETSIIHLLR